MTDVRLFATDLDGTLVGNPATTRIFIDTWSSIPDDQRPLLVFNSGRLVEDMQHLIESGQVPRPDYLIGGVGTEIVDLAHHQVMSEYHNRPQATSESI